MFTQRKYAALKRSSKGDTAMETGFKEVGHISFVVMYCSRISTEILYPNKRSDGVDFCLLSLPTHNGDLASGCLC